MKKIIISAEDELFKMNRILNINWAKKFPGASWIYFLSTLVCGDFEVVTSDVALSHVNTNFWNSSDLFVIQHGVDKNAEELIRKGAYPLVLTCFESPLYIGSFYDNFKDNSQIFKVRIVPNGLFVKNNLNSVENDFFYFPSFFQRDLLVTRESWSQRKFMSMVVSNKYVFVGHKGFELSVKYLTWWGKAKIIGMFFARDFSSRSINAKKIQLQDMRLEYIHFFKMKKLLDLFGGGWENLNNLPPKWQRNLSGLLDSSRDKKIENKLDTISKYKFNLCIENAEFDGYITEKIIEAMVAKTIPVYFGAPDIERFIPSSCFVNARNFKSLEELSKYLQNMNTREADQIIESGQAFLRSESGSKYSYEGFSLLIREVVLKYAK